VFSIALPRALEVLAMAKGKDALRVLGNHPQDGGEVAIYDGRFGAYVQHGKIRATLGKSESVEAIALERALELLAAKEEKEKGAPKKAASRKPAAKKTKS
jgi:DNA topoisomerase-1